jgi:hypothetical protein
MRGAIVCVALAGAIASASAASATSFTKIGGPAGTESNLRNIMAGVLGAGYGNGNLLTTNVRTATDGSKGRDYSFGGLTAYRIYDIGVDTGTRMNVAYFDAGRDDNGWADGVVDVSVKARFAAYSQGLGTTVAGQQLSVTGNGFNPGMSGNSTFSTGAIFEWLRYGDNGPHSSSDHADKGMDNMVSWAVLDSSGKLVSWVLAFDDNGNKNDRDFQDLVVEVSTVARAIPLPAGGSMASVALLGLAGMRRRRSV